MTATVQGTSEKLNIEIEYKVQGCKGKTLPLIIAKKCSKALFLSTLKVFYDQIKETPIARSKICTIFFCFRVYFLTYEQNLL